MIAIIACGSDKVEKISDIVSELGYKNEILSIDDITPENNTFFDRYDAIIISGSPTTVTRENKQQYIERFSFIGNVKTPILGICFGHQIIGHYFGCKYSIGAMIDGPNKIDVVNRGEPLFQNIRRKMFHENHEEEISLPSSFRLLAYSSNCKNEAMKQIHKEIYGVQFHPELS